MHYLNFVFAKIQNNLETANCLSPFFYFFNFSKSLFQRLFFCVYDGDGQLGCKKESTISELSIPQFYVDYPIFSQLKYPLFMF